MTYSWPVTVAEAKTMITKSDSVDDVELGGFVDAITAVVESITGPVNSTTFTEVYSPSESSKLFLRHCPILTVTSVTEYRGAATYVLTNQPVGAATDVYGYSIDDLTYGTLTRRATASVEVPFGDIVKVVYQAGYASVPANIRLGALELIRENWIESKNMGRRVPVDEQWGQGGYFVPPRVRELLRPNTELPGIA